MAAPTNTQPHSPVSLGAARRGLPGALNRKRSARCAGRLRRRSANPRGRGPKSSGWSP